MDNYWILVVFFGLVINESKTWCYAEEQLFEGSNCIVESSNDTGICRYVTDCQQFFKHLRENRLKVSICHNGKKGDDFVMCCPLSYTQKIGIKEPGLTLAGAVKKSSLNLDDCIEKYIEFGNSPSRSLIIAANGENVYKGEFQNIVSLNYRKSTVN